MIGLIVSDKLTKNLVKEAVNRDIKENLAKRPRDQTQTHLDNLVKAFCSCGVTFSVWEKSDADQRKSGLHDFTSLMGTDKKLVLGKLSTKLDGIITPATSSAVINLLPVL